MIRIGNLELHVTHGCNLVCESCSHYSNQGHKGHLSLEEAESWMRAWDGRIAPQTFSLLGGEPTIHPELPAFVDLTRRMYPRTSIRIVTNGFFLHRHPELPEAMVRAGDATLYVSQHHPSQEYFEKLQPNLDLLKGWMRDHGVRAKIYPSADLWTRRYKGQGAEMAPYSDGRPQESWENCSARFCRQLYQGKIWKCAPLAYLGMQHEKYGLSEDWDHYLGYQPIGPECSDAELVAFLKRQGESYCGMCPAQPEHFELPLPFPSRRARAGSA